jgi:hypothetical protein
MNFFFIILFVFCSIYFFVGFIKEKRVSKLFLSITQLLAVFLNTPLGMNVHGTGGEVLRWSAYSLICITLMLFVREKFIVKKR